MTKENWVGGLARLSRTTDWADEKSMGEGMRWGRMIGKGILMGQNGKENRNKNREEFFGC
jgi:hypothetical protein